jgi:predicted amidophosphoribosyltransferase
VRRAITYRHVLIIDDIITTGATAGRLALVVRSAGAEKVSVLTVARA